MGAIEYGAVLSGTALFIYVQGMISPLTKIRLEVAAESVGAFAEVLEPFALSVVWTDDEDHRQANEAVVAICERPPDMEALRHALAAVADAFSLPVPQPVIETLAERDWVADNKLDFPPIPCGRFVIHTPEQSAEVPAGRIGITIPPAGAFGTGKHGSTQGCLAALGDLPRLRPGPVLDMGCGSGILAIAAWKLWRRPSVGADIDPRAAEETNANARMNGLGRSLRAVASRGYRHPEIRRQSYALIFANILAKPLSKMARDLSHALLPGGVCILSGLVDGDGPMVLARHRAHGLIPVRAYRVDGWLTLVMRKPG